MSSGIRPSSDKPAVDYYFQPWWVREVFRFAEIIQTTDLTVLNERDVKSLAKAAKVFVEKFPES
jgi:hypothetical protein